MRHRRSRSGDTVWAPLADVMTLTACVFLLVYLATLVAWSHSQDNLREKQQQLETENRKAEELKQKLREQQATAESAFQVLQSLAGQGIELGPNRTIKIADSLLFELGSAELRPEGAELVKTRIAPAIARATNIAGVTILVSGHTDSLPIRGAAFGNWTLSTQRASNVVALLLGSGQSIRPDRIQAAGFADTRPSEQPPSNARNRRVEFHVQVEQADVLSQLDSGAANSSRLGGAGREGEFH